MYKTKITKKPQNKTNRSVSFISNNLIIFCFDITLLNQSNFTLHNYKRVPADDKLLENASIC